MPVFKKMPISPGKLQWLGSALKLDEVLSDQSALEKTLDSLPTLSFEVWPSDQQIIVQGMAGDDLFVLYSGRLAVWRADEDRPTRKIGSLRPGDFFGEIGFLLSSARSATVVTESEARVFRVPAVQFAELLRESPALLRLVKSIARKRLSKLFA